MKNRPTKDQVASWIEQIKAVPEYLDELDIISLKETLLYIKEWERDSIKYTESIISSTPNHKYPSEYQNDKGLYWVREGMVVGKELYNLSKIINQRLEGLGKSESPQGIKMPSKYYALLHWIGIELGLYKLFERNTSDNYSKKEIEEYASVHYPLSSKQGFYKAFREIDTTNKVAIARNFGKGYKKKIIELSGNDSRIEAHLKKWPE